MAIKFLNKWGCEVLAFSSSKDKEAEILGIGASRVINSKDPDALGAIKGKLNFLLNTTNVTHDWDAYLSILAPKGRFHNVGAVLEPMAIPAFSLIMGEKSVAGCQLGRRALTATILDFCVCHEIYPIVEEFPMKKVNEAMKHLEEGKARYHIVLRAD